MKREAVKEIKDNQKKKRNDKPRPRPEALERHWTSINSKPASNEIRV